MKLTPKDYERIKEGLSFWLKRWEDNPLAYVIECIGDTPTHQQAEILKALPKHKFVAAKSGHGIGKTKLISWIDSWWGDTRFRKRAVHTGAGGDAIKNTIWPEISHTTENKWEFLASRWEITGKQKKNIEVDDGWFSVLRTASKDNPQALAGFHDCLFVIDEASSVPEGVFEVARGAMGDPQNYGLMLGNPTKTSGYFYNTFKNRSGVWHCMTFSSEDSLYEEEYSYDYVNPLGQIETIKVHGRQTKAWIQSMKDDFGENSNAYKYRVLGEFASDKSDNVIEKSWLDNVFQGTKVIRDKTRPRIMGVDVARFGNDDSALCIRQGDDIIHVETWHGKDTVITTQKVKEAAETWQVDYVYVDVIGVGAGVYDNLKYVPGFPVYPCNVSQKAPEHEKLDAKKTSCKALRDWLWWQGRLFFRQRQVRFHGSHDNKDWGTLFDELHTPTYSSPNGVVVVESKEDMKKRGAHSPNIADALLMTLMRDWKNSKSEGHNGKLRSQRKKKKKMVYSFKTA